jgi:hypothetical protein
MDENRISEKYARSGDMSFGGGSVRGVSFNNNQPEFRGASMAAM